MTGARPDVVTPAPRELWQQLVDDDPDALPSQTPDWTDSICRTGAFTDASRLYTWADGRQLCLPMVRRTRLPSRLTTEASQPFGWGSGGLVAGGGDVRREDVAAMFADLIRRPALRSMVRPGPRSGDTYAAGAPTRVLTVPYLAQVLDLEGGFERLWTSRFTGAVRSAVRKAERSRLVVERDSTGRLVPVFHELYQASVARWARQQHEPLALARLRAERRDPRSKFVDVAARLGNRCTVWTAELDGQAVAAIIVLRQGRTATYWRGAMNKELAGPPRANDLLHRLAIEDAARSGDRYYSMGDSSPESSLARYKARFGTTSYHYAGYRLERLPLTRADVAVRSAAKRILRFREA